MRARALILTLLAVAVMAVSASAAKVVEFKVVRVGNTLKAPNTSKTINNFNALSDQIFVNTGDNLSFGQAYTLDPSNFHTGNEAVAATWNGGSGKEFVFNNVSGELW